MKLTSYILLTAVLFLNIAFNVGTPIFGDCQSDNDTCAHCYLKLKESLLKRDINVRNLSATFFPPRNNIPDFVTVTYCFDEGCNSTRKWFWTHDSSYLFFPQNISQYMSLFFGKPAALFSGSIILMLDEECHNSTLFDLLTQRLKNFAQRESFEPVIDDNYFARALDSHGDDLSTPTARYILSFYVVGLVFAIVIAVMILLIYFNTKRWDRKLGSAGKTTKGNKYFQSKIFSVAATSFFISVYAIVLDGLAVNTIREGNVAIDEHYVHALPYYVLAVDFFGALIWIFCWIFSFCSFIFRQHKEYVGLAISTLGPTLTLIVHLPYIAIAYLNDASYATSIFIYYTITTFILFGVLDLTYGTCQGAILHAQHRNDSEQSEDDGCFICCPKSKNRRRCVFIFIIPTFTLVILCLTCMITAALVIIPISKAFSDVPNRLLGFYQTAVVFVGAILIYRSFFMKKPSIELAVKKREDYIPTKTVTSRGEWERLSKDEKVEQFYSRLVDIVAKIPIEKLQIPDTTHGKKSQATTAQDSQDDARNEHAEDTRPLLHAKPSVVMSEQS